MRETILIPSTLDDALAQLGGLGDLLRAREWERAAIVAAFVRLGEVRGRHVSSDMSAFDSPVEFAARGIVGLKSHVTVTRYVQHWLKENDNNYPARGAKVVLPDAPWPPVEMPDALPHGNGHASPRNVAAAIEEHDDAADAAVDALGKRRLTSKQRKKLLNTLAADSGEEAPFDTPPVVPNVDEAQIDKRTRINHVAAGLDLLRIHLNHHPAAWIGDEDAALRVERLGDRCHALAAVIRGMTDNDLDALLRGDEF